MSFGAPEFALLVVLLPLGAGILLGLGRRNRARRLHSWAAPETAARLNRQIKPLGRRLRSILLCCALALVGLALTRPQWGYHYEEVKRRGIDLAIVIDVSESMRAEDVSPSRLERAKRELSDFLDIVDGDRVALVAAAGTSFIQCPLTLDYGALRSFISLIDTDLIPTPGTDLAGALQTAGRALQTGGPARGRAIILISDGGNLEGDPLAVAKALHAQDITLYAIGIGDPESGVPIPTAEGGFKEYDGKIITTMLEEDALKQIAKAGQGEYVRAVTGDLDLEIIHQHIRAAHTEAELGASQRKVYHERFVWPLGFAILCLVLEPIIPVRTRTLAGLALTALVVAQPSNAFADIARDTANGIEAYAAERFDEARDTFTQVRDAAPTDARALHNLGAAEYKSGNPSDAAQLFIDAAAHTDDAALRAQSYYNAGNAYAHAGKLDKAVEAYESSLRIDSSRTEAKANLELVRKLIEEHEQQQQERNEEEQQKQEQQEREQQENEDGDNANDNQRQPDPPEDEDPQFDSESPPQEPDNQQPEENPSPQEQQSDSQSSESDQGQQQQQDRGTQSQPQPSPGGEQPEGGAETQESPAPGRMTEEEANQWLRQLPDEEGEALKRFWQGQQPRPSGRPKRDW